MALRAETTHTQVVVVQGGEVVQVHKEECEFYDLPTYTKKFGKPLSGAELEKRGHFKRCYGGIEGILVPRPPKKDQDQDQDQSEAC